MIYDGVLCDNIISESHFTLQCSSNLDDEGIVKLFCMLLASVPMRKLEAWERRNSEDSSISHIGTLFLFSKRGKIIYCFLCWEMVLLRYTHLYSGVSAKPKVSKAWKFVISKHQIFSATNFDSKNCVFNQEVNKPGLRRIYLHMIPD